MTTIVTRAGKGSELTHAEVDANFTNLAANTVDVQTHAATDKATPVDADEMPLSDSAAAFGLKKLSWANLKATLKAYFDTVYPTPNADTTGTAAKANALNSATTVVNVSSATAPTSGQVLTATSGTAATWQTPSGGSGAGYEVGQVVLATTAPTTGTWLETGKYYSKSTYPTLASKVGTVADFGTPVSIPQAQLPQSFATNTNTYSPYIVATDGSTVAVVGTAGAIRTSTDGVTWKGVPSTTTKAFNEIRYVNSNFVAVGASGTIVSSSDGTTWVSRASASSANINSVAYGNGKYVCVDASGTIQYSSDLITWTKANGIPTTSTFYRVIYGNSTFVVVGQTNETVCYTSTDGVTWTSQSVGESTVYDVIYANSLFVLTTGNNIKTSSDGATWTTRQATSNAQYSVSYVNSLFISPGANGKLYTSADGLTWTLQTTNTTRSLYTATWNGTSYVVVGTNGVYLTSSDGTSWTAALDSSLSSFYAVNVVDGKAIAYGATSSVILAGATRSEVLQQGVWAYSVSAQSAANPRTIAYNGSSTYVAIGSNGTILSSTDTLDWTGRYANVTTNFDKVQWVNASFIAMGGSGSNANLLTSTDGISWTSRSAGSAIYNAAAYGASTYVVVGAGGVIYYSTDLSTWTLCTGTGTQIFNDVIYANSIFVAVGAAGACYSSTDGITWTSRSAGSSAFLRIIYANSLFVAVGASGAIYTSANGTSWSASSSGVGSQLNDVVWNGSIFCAVGAAGTIVTSSIGIGAWVARTPGDSVALISVSWNGTRFIATNTGQSSAWTSTDGLTWVRVATAYQTTTSIYSCYLGGKFLMAGNGYIQVSTDGLNWSTCNHVQYIPTSINRMYNFGNYYYALTKQGLFQSSDGINFSLASRSIPWFISDVGIRAMAYNGSIFVLQTGGATGQPQAFFKSTDGVTWTKTAELYTNTSTSLTGNAGVDVVYANGNFIAGQFISIATGVPFAIYTSSDGETWTGRLTPYLSSTNAAIATDGTTAVFGTSTGQYKSTDGGVTWSLFASFTVGAVLYSKNTWLWVNNSYTVTSPDLVTFYSSGSTLAGQAIPSIYVSGDIIVGISSMYKTYLNRKASGNVQLPSMGSVNINYSNTTKETPIRGTTALLAITPSNAYFPNLILETPIYSYDTATTFWVPPSNTGVGQQTYMYAGA